MRASLEFLLGILDQDDPPAVTWDDWTGPHADGVRMWQRIGFVGTEPGPHPFPSCPGCGEGVPYRIGDRCVCPACCTPVDPRHLLLWPVDLPAFLGWLAGDWGLTGGVRRIDGRLWQLGTRAGNGTAREFFYRRPGALTAAGVNRFAAYRRAVVLHGLPAAGLGDGFDGPRLCLMELLHMGDNLTARDPDGLLRPRGNVRFDAATGGLWAGDAWLGEVPVMCKEYHLLRCLADHVDAFVPYTDLKAEVLRATGSRDGTDEATFCQKLKSRIKRRVPAIDRLIATTNKGDGYRLRGWVEPS
jgi:hypothetical protein